MIHMTHTAHRHRCTTTLLYRAWINVTTMLEAASHRYVYQYFDVIRYQYAISQLYHICTIGPITRLMLVIGMSPGLCNDPIM